MPTLLQVPLFHSGLGLEGSDEVLKINNILMHYLKKIKSIPIVYEEQNIKRLNKARRSITDFSFCLKLYHGKAGLLILFHCFLSFPHTPH